MKSPVVKGLWNLRMTIVPPTEMVMRMSVDNTEENASGVDRVDTVQNDRTVRRNVTAKIEYHHPAMSFLVDPLHSFSARIPVKYDTRNILVQSASARE